MKPILYVLVFLLLIAAVCVHTRPPKEDHIKKMSSVINEAMQDEASLYGAFPAMIASEIEKMRLVDELLDRIVVVEDYGVATVGKVYFNGEEYMISLGVMDNVITFSKEQLKEAVVYMLKNGNLIGDDLKFAGCAR
ncbi:MAG: hypothetical protein IKJ95_08365 [Bacteroidaceae bacterium]|nr:hypothetical protein [Bacteroidaceae bacterium]